MHKEIDWPLPNGVCSVIPDRIKWFICPSQRLATDDGSYSTYKQSIYTNLSRKTSKKHQTNTSANGNTNSMAFHVKDEAKKTIAGQTYNKYQRKERPINTYYNYTSHAIEKYYQLHGYPPGYKAKQRFDPNQSDSSRQVAHALQIKFLIQSQNKLW